MVLLKFSFKIEHCIEWSMEIFNKYFNELIEDVKELTKVKLILKIIQNQ